MHYYFPVLALLSKYKSLLENQYKKVRFFRIDYPLAIQVMAVAHNVALSLLCSDLSMALRLV